MIDRVDGRIISVQLQAALINTTIWPSPAAGTHAVMTPTQPIKCRVWRVKRFMRFKWAREVRAIVHWACEDRWVGRRRSRFVGGSLTLTADAEPDQDGEKDGSYHGPDGDTSHRALAEG